MAALATRGTLWGAQFHPEKSGATGLALLANFVRLAEAAVVMELLPAIDLRAGTAVRLTQGDFERQARYGDPVALAERFVAGGARWIHVVDLDGARTGVPHERGALARIVRAGRRGRASGVRPAAASAPRTMRPRCSTRAWRGWCWAPRPSRTRRWPPAAPAAGPGRWRSGSTTGRRRTGWPRPRATAGWPDRARP